METMIGGPEVIKIVSDKIVFLGVPFVVSLNIPRY